jgi:uncharacterized NAD(P)/FAD-binding protein YdhS
MRRVMIVALAVGLVGSACTAATSASAPNSSDTPTAIVTPADASAESDTNLDDDVAVPGSAITQDDLARFIASAEAALTGTSHEGVIVDSPELYIALAQASCARFSAGESLQDIVNDLLGHTDTTPQEDDKQLIGAILGAGTATICPEHTNKV